MAISINGATGISGVDGSAATPAVQGSDTNTGISFGTDTVSINTGGTARATVDSSGRLLVGASSARTDLGGLQPKLQVEGTSFVDGAISAVVNSATGSTAPSIVLAKSAGASIGSNTLVSSGDVLGRIRFQGNDGSNFDTAAWIQCDVDGTPGSNDMPGRLVFSTTADGASSPTERMRIRNTGSQLLATADNSEPGIQLNVNASSGSQNGMRITTANDQNSIFQYFFACYGSSTQRATIRTDGGLANYSANNANLSDRNAKKDISPAANTWDCIKEWEIVNYRYKDQPDNADLNLGVIAQQVAESCPEVVTVFSEAKEAKPAVLDNDGNEVEAAQEAQPEKLGIKEQQMYWMAIKALQEAQARIESLEARLTTLEGGTN